MYFYEINPYNILLEKSYKSSIITFKLCNFEYYTTIIEKDPLIYYKDKLPFTFPASNDSELISNIHKNNIYSLGLTCLTAATLDNIIKFNNPNDLLKIIEYINNLQYPKCIKDIFTKMMPIKEAQIISSPYLLKYLKHIKSTHFKEIFFEELGKSKSQTYDQHASSIYLFKENLLILYNQEANEFQLYTFQNKELALNEIEALCFDGQNKFYFLNYQVEPFFFSFNLSTYENDSFFIQPLEKPGFFIYDKNSQVNEAGLIYYNQQVYLISGSVNSNLAKFNSKNCYKYSIDINKWSIISTLHQQLTDCNAILPLNQHIYCISLIIQENKKSPELQNLVFVLQIYSIKENTWNIQKINYKISKNILGQKQKWSLLPILNTFILIYEGFSKISLLLSMNSNKVLNLNNKIYEGDEEIQTIYENYPFEEKLKNEKFFNAILYLYDSLIILDDSAVNEIQLLKFTLIENIDLLKINKLSISIN